MFKDLFSKTKQVKIDFIIILLIIPLIYLSQHLIEDISIKLAQKQTIYIILGIVVFSIFFLFPIRRLFWIIPYLYWTNIILLAMVLFFGVSKLGAQRWLELPILGFTVQPSEFIKPAFILMLAYLIRQSPPPPEGYGLKDFLQLSFYILLPFCLVVVQPDLGTASILLIIGGGILLMVGIRPQIWIALIAIFAIVSPIIYTQLLHDYQKKRIKDFLSEKPSYQVKQSIIAIGNGGLSGKEKDRATQSHLKFLPHCHE